MPAPTFTNLIANATGTDGTSVTTASVSPTGNRLILLSVHAKRNTTAQPPQPTISGGGMTTWTFVEDCIVDSSGSDRANTWIFRSLQSSPGSGTITIDFGAVTCHDFAWSVDQSDSSVKTTGTNGADAIGNMTFADDDGAGTSVSASLTINSGNGGFSAAGCQGNPPNWTVRSSWNELGNSGQGSCRLLTQYENATDTAVSATHANSRSGIVGLEIVAAASALDQVAYRGYADDAAMGSATAKANQNTGWTQLVDENFRVRFEIQNTTAVTDTTSMKLQYNLNSAGWNDVTGASSVVRSSASPNVTNGASTADLLTAGTGTFIAGAFDEDDGAVASVSVTGSNHTEHEFCMQIRSADVADADTIQLRVVRGTGSLDAHTAIPSITVDEPSATVDLSDLKFPADGSFLPPIVVSGTTYVCGVDETTTTTFHVRSSTTPGNGTVWTENDSDALSNAIGAMAWVLESTTIHILAMDNTSTGRVRYWSFNTGTGALSTVETVSDAPQHAAPTMAGVSIAYDTEPVATYTADRSLGADFAVETQNRATPSAGQWQGTEEFLSSNDFDGQGGSLVVRSGSTYGWYSEDTTGICFRVSSTPGTWGSVTSRATNEIVSTTHPLTNAVVFDTGSGAQTGVAYLGSDTELWFVGESLTAEIVDITPLTQSQTVAASLVVDSNSKPHIVYVGSDGSIQHVSRASGAWSAPAEVQPSSVSANFVYATWSGSQIVYFYDPGGGVGLSYGTYTPTTLEVFPKPIRSPNRAALERSVRW